YFDSGQYLVLCAQKEQMELLSQSLYVEIDMVFKRIHSTANEWEICIYVYRYQKEKFDKTSLLSQKNSI
ncbi:28385_t:CDS:2, partial [Gigaspora margarita]